jgi:hypothetical protein
MSTPIFSLFKTRPTACLGQSTEPDNLFEAQRAGLILAQAGATSAGLGTHPKKEPASAHDATLATPAIQSGTHRSNPAPSWFGVPPSGGAFVATQPLLRMQFTTRQIFLTPEGPKGRPYLSPGRSQRRRPGNKIPKTLKAERAERYQLRP